MKENKFQKQVKKQLESQAAFVINTHGHLMQISGLPDLLVIHKDWKGWLELKVEKGKCSALQRIQATKIELRGMPIYVLRCVEAEAIAILEDFPNCEIHGDAHIYTLENFQGDIIKEFYSIKELLDILCELKLDKWNES